MHKDIPTRIRGAMYRALTIISNILDNDKAASTYTRRTGDWLLVLAVRYDLNGNT